MTVKLPIRNFQNVQDIESYYLDNITKYGVTAPRTMGYHSSPIDDRLIVNMLPQSMPETYSVLDVGCGLAQIVPILKSRFPDKQLARLLGIDLVDDFIEGCIKQYQQYDFLTANFLEWQSNEQFDLVIAAGVLVTKISDFEGYLEKFVKKMLLASKGWIGFNVVANCGPSYTAKHLATISDEKLNSILKNFSNVEWELETKEVFSGAKDIFVRGKILCI